MEKNTLSLEKINADRITSLEQKVDRQLELVNTKLDRVLEKVLATKPDGNGNASWVRQSIGLTVAVISLIGFMVPTMVAIVRPMQQQIDYLRSYIVEDKEDNMRERNQFMELYDKNNCIAQERTNARFDKLEEWQKWWYRDVPYDKERGVYKNLP